MQAITYSVIFLPNLSILQLHLRQVQPPKNISFKLLGMRKIGILALHCGQCDFFKLIFILALSLSDINRLLLKSKFGKYTRL